MSHRIYATFARLVYTRWHGVVEGFEYRIDKLSGRHVVSIAGTKDARDAVFDARFLPRWEDGIGLVSGGFWDVAKDMAVRVGYEVGMAPHVVFNGHSAGGAIAMLCAAHMVSNGVPIAEVVTYGAPKIGRLKVLDSVPVTQYRYGRDMITYLGIRSHTEVTPVGVASKWRPNLADHTMVKYVATVP